MAAALYRLITKNQILILDHVSLTKNVHLSKTMLTNVESYRVDKSFKIADFMSFARGGSSSFSEQICFKIGLIAETITSCSLAKT